MVNFITILLSTIACIAAINGNAQTIVNGQLNGTAGIDNVPTSWLQISYTDPISQALSPLEATSDVLNATGPDLMGGIAGIPQIGSTFTSGLHCGIAPNYLWHEGIMQTISGFTIGTEYNLSFYQTIVKQTNALDESGSWRVYLDGTLLLTSVVSTSTLAANDINLVWDNRSLTFTATAATHTLKFIPWDDDTNIEGSITDITGGLRMGIDNIQLIENTPMPPIVNLGTNQSFCIGDTLLLDATNPNSSYLWQDGSTDSTYMVTLPGTYWVEVTNADGTASDTVVIAYSGPPVVTLASDTVLCENQSLVLSPGVQNVAYLWQDNSTASTLVVSSAGQYSLTVTNNCGSDTDTIEVLYIECPSAIEMPNVFTPNGDQVNDFFHPRYIYEVEIQSMTILNRWGELVFQSDDLIEMWDGRHRGLECKTGVYFWIVAYKDQSDKIHQIHGNLQLIR